MDFSTVSANLRARGFSVSEFATTAEAATYLNQSIDQQTVGLGGSATLQDLDIYRQLGQHNEVYWHWEEPARQTRVDACNAQVYLSSVNALAESGELVNIDGMGNRLAGTLFGPTRVYFVIGQNKLCPSYEDAVRRARDVAAPARAKQLGKNPPCTVKLDHCYDCRSEDRVCRAMTTIWAPMMGMEVEVVLIHEDLGL